MDKYFVYDTENNEFLTCNTKQEQKEIADSIIDYYINDDGIWDENIEGIISGVITKTATKCDVIHRENVEIDEDGFDEDGRYWLKEFNYFCRYEMKDI